MDPGDIRGRADQTSPADHAGGHPWPAWAGAPEIHYVKAEDGYVAYQIFGEGSYDVLFIGNWASNIEVMWEHPSMARYLERLGRFARVICFDKRGAGLSDPVPLGALPTLEHWMDDARIVLDAAGSEQAALIGDAEGGLDGHDVRGHVSATHSSPGTGKRVCQDATGGRLLHRNA
jgi:hypothetical protein